MPVSTSSCVRSRRLVVDKLLVIFAFVLPLPFEWEFPFLSVESLGPIFRKVSSEWLNGLVLSIDPCTSKWRNERERGRREDRRWVRNVRETYAGNLTRCHRNWILACMKMAQDGTSNDLAFWTRIALLLGRLWNIDISAHRSSPRAVWEWKDARESGVLQQFLLNHDRGSSGKLHSAPLRLDGPLMGYQVATSNVTGALFVAMHFPTIPHARLAGNSDEYRGGSNYKWPRRGAHRRFHCST